MTLSTHDWITVLDHIGVTVSVCRSCGILKMRLWAFDPNDPPREHFYAAMDGTNHTAPGGACPPTAAGVGSRERASDAPGEQSPGVVSSVPKGDVRGRTQP